MGGRSRQNRQRFPTGPEIQEEIDGLVTDDAFRRLRIHAAGPDGEETVFTHVLRPGAHLVVDPARPGEDETVIEVRERRYDTTMYQTAFAAHHATYDTAMHYVEVTRTVPETPEEIALRKYDETFGPGSKNAEDWDLMRVALKQISEIDFDSREELADQLEERKRLVTSCFLPPESDERSHGTSGHS